MTPEVGEPDVIVEPDLPPDTPEPEPDVVAEVVEDTVLGPECVAPIDCINKLSDQFESCETAACESGVCNIVPIEGCCLADEECPGYADACCETITCNLDTSQCESPPRRGVARPRRSVTTSIPRRTTSAPPPASRMAASSCRPSATTT